MKKAGLIALGLLVVLTSQQVAAEVRTWVGSNGSRLEAEFVKEVGGKVVLRSKDGKELNVPRSYLAKEDIEYLDLKTPPKASIEATVKVLEVETKDGAEGKVVDSRIYVKKTSPAPYSLSVKATLFLIGIVGDEHTYVILQRSESDLRFTPENKNRPEFVAPELSLYDLSIEGVFGIEYEGYLIIVTDPKGHVLAVESNRTGLEKNGAKVLRFKVGDLFDEHFEPVK